MDLAVGFSSRMFTERQLKCPISWYCGLLCHQNSSRLVTKLSENVLGIQINCTCLEMEGELSVTAYLVCQNHIFCSIRLDSCNASFVSWSRWWCLDVTRWRCINGQWLEVLKKEKIILRNRKDLWANIVGLSCHFNPELW